MIHLAEWELLFLEGKMNSKDLWPGWSSSYISNALFIQWTSPGLFWNALTGRGGKFGFLLHWCQWLCPHVNEQILVHFVFHLFLRCQLLFFLIYVRVNIARSKTLLRTAPESSLLFSKSIWIRPRKPPCSHISYILSILIWLQSLWFPGLTFKWEKTFKMNQY